MRRILFNLLITTILTATGCRTSEQQRVDGLMWYRRPPRPPAKSLTFSVGRQGHTMESGVGARLSEAAGGFETGLRLSRAGRTAAIGVSPEISAMPLNPPPRTGAGQSPEPGIRLEVAGQTATIGSSNETAARVAAGP